VQGVDDSSRFRLVTEGYSTWLPDGAPVPQGRSGGEAAVPAERKYVGISATLWANGEPVAVNRYDTATFTGGTVYLGKDALGSVRGATNDYGLLEERYEYDAFGKPYKGDLNGGMNLGYTGKPYDTATGMYNYGYRDYQPEVARFTTIDPIRDGANWFAYVNNDPVNYTDPDGRAINFVIGAVVGFLSSSVAEVGGRMALGQNFGEAVKNTFTDLASLAVIGASTVIGAVTSGVSGLAVSAATKGTISAVQVATTTVAINTVSGAVDAAAKDIAVKAITGQPQNIKETAAIAGAGALWAAGASTFTQGSIAAGSMPVTTTLSNSYGVEAGTHIRQPNWAGSVGVIGETIIPTAIDIGKTVYTQLKEGNKCGF
jgi:RHS repeat-associated protein